MLTFPHTLVAAAIVRLFPNPLICLPLALLSHFMLDFFVIHWNPHLYTEFHKSKKIAINSLKIVIGDALFALAFCLLIVLRYLPNTQLIALFASAIFLATLPDTIEIPYYFFGSHSKLLEKYIDFQHRHQSNGNAFWGIITQAAAIILSSLVFFS